MSQIGRNDPCLCGSGLKYKKCCASKAAASSDLIPWQASQARHWIDVDQKLSAQLFRMLKSHPEETHACFERLGFLDGGPEDEVLFAFCLLFMAYHLPINGRTVAQQHYDAARMHGDMRVLVECQLDHYITLFQAVEIEPGRGVLLNDVLFGRELFVWDVGLSNSISLNGGLVGWAVTIDQINFLGAAHPHMLPPSLFHAVRDELKQYERLTRKDLQGEKAELLIYLWNRTLDNWNSGPAPQLCNTDVDPLLWVEDRFTFPKGLRSEVWTAILSMPGAKAQTADTIGFSEDRPDGPMDNISVGTAKVGDDTILLQTNSLKRGNRLRKAVEAACAGLELVKKRRKSKSLDPASLPSSPAQTPEQELSQQELMQLPEVRAKMMEIRQKMNEHWLDLKNPMFGGHSPRELAKTTAGRVRLQKVMEEFEYRGDPPEEVQWLRSQLGLL